MKALVVYDTLHGNTEKIAHAICAGLASADGASAGGEAVKASDVQPDHLAGIDLLLVGPPTHGS